MRHFSIAKIAKKWNISERSIRNYCAQGRVGGAFLTGKTWNLEQKLIERTIPHKPNSKNQKYRKCKS